VSPSGEGRLVHHELCFGCGRANLFGLLTEAQAGTQGAVSGRCFIKQDHQGPAPGKTHPGILAAALIETMALASGVGKYPESVQIEFAGQPAVGGFLDLEAEVESVDGRHRTVHGRARSEGTTVVAGRAVFWHEG